MKTKATQLTLLAATMILTCSMASAKPVSLWSAIKFNAHNVYHNLIK